MRQKKLLKKKLREKQYQNIIEIGEPISAASIAQVHSLKLKMKIKKKK